MAMGKKNVFEGSESRISETETAAPAAIRRSAPSAARGERKRSVSRIASGLDDRSQPPKAPPTRTNPRAIAAFDLTVTASIGTCVGALARETDWKAMYRCADRALFEAKAAGRDRVRNGEPLARAA